MNAVDAINTASYIKGINTEIRTDQRNVAGFDQKDDQKIRSAEQEAREKRVLEDTAHPDADSVLVGRNRDGDTTKASRVGLESLREGIVIKKDPVENSGADPKAAQDPKAEEKVGSMLGYTDTQVEELYYQGRISKNDYETELARRDRIDKEAGIKTEDKDDEEKNPVVEESKEEAKKVSEEKALKAKESDVAPEDSIGRKDEDKEKAEGADENRKKLISDEMEQDNAFAREMGQINQRQQDFSLRADAITEGIANERADKVVDILDAAEKIANGQEGAGTDNGTGVR